MCGCRKNSPIRPARPRTPSAPGPFTPGRTVRSGQTNIAPQAPVGFAAPLPLPPAPADAADRMRVEKLRREQIAKHRGL